MPDYSHDLPQNYYFGGGDDATSATPLAVVFLLVAIFLILVLPRKYACVPFLVAALLVPLHVVLLIGTLHFNATRILVLTGWLRLMVRHERFPGYLRILDKMILACALSNAVMYSLLWQDFGAVVNRLGYLVTTMGSYFLMRFLIRDQEDVVRAIKALGAVAMVVAPSMLYEYATAYNPFWLLGAPEITNLRDGQIRAQGPFGHPVTAGVIGAFLPPLFAGLLLERGRTRVLAGFALIASTMMVALSHSSTPVMTYGAALLGLAMWPMRNSMRKVRWGIVIGLVVLQFAIQSPVWFAMNRASALLGGSGWHRSMLVDNFVRHFSEWWLVGTRLNPNWGWSMWDVDNAYVGAGISGGLLSFVLFIAVIVYAFKTVGAGRKLVVDFPREQRLIWVLGTALFANAVAYLGIVYFDQGIVAWYALLAMIAVIPAFAMKSADLRQPAEVILPEITAPFAVPSLRWHDPEAGRLPR